MLYGVCAFPCDLTCKFELVDDIFSGHWGGGRTSDGVSETCMLSDVDVCGMNFF